MSPFRGLPSYQRVCLKHESVYRQYNLFLPNDRQVPAEHKENLLRGRQSNDIKPVLPTKIICQKLFVFVRGQCQLTGTMIFSPICQTVLVGAAHNPDRRNKNVNKLNGILFILTFGLLDSRYKFVFYIGMYHSFLYTLLCKTNSTVITVTN